MEVGSVDIGLDYVDRMLLVNIDTNVMSVTVALSFNSNDARDSFVQRNLSRIMDLSKDEEFRKALNTLFRKIVYG